MIHPIAAAARQNPGQVILRTGAHDWTSEELLDAIQRRAGGLLQRGIKPGERIGITGPACADWLIAMHAIGWIGAIATPLAHGQPLKNLIAAAQPSAVLRPAGMDPGQEHALDWHTEGPPALQPFAPSPDDARLCLTTSGTTGLPRPIVLTWGQVTASADASMKRLGSLQDDVWLGCLPLHHIGGLSVFLRTAHACTTGYLHDGFDAQAVAALLASGEISQISLVPAMLRQILDQHPSGGFHPRLRLMLIGGAPMPPDLMDRARSLQLPLAITWGMTEAASQVATRTPGDLRDDPDVGHPLPGLEVHTDAGFLVVKGPTVPGGLWKTADRGCLDETGRVIVYGRGSDLIISGGENIDPLEVERALQMHPAIAQAAVVGRSDSKWGERPIAFLVASGSVRPSLVDLKQHLAEHIAKFKAPDHITWMAQLPRGPLGKLKRSALIDESGSSQAIQKD